MILFELWTELKERSWDHRVLKIKKGDPPPSPFLHGRDKVLYLRKGRITGQRTYWLALLTASENPELWASFGNNEIHHLQTDSYYQCLLDGCRFCELFCCKAMLRCYRQSRVLGA